MGCFLVRVSENRFGYTLSYRIRTRCRHYMVEQDVRGRYALVGVEKVRAERFACYLLCTRKALLGSLAARVRTYAFLPFLQICTSLNSLIEWFQRNRINPEGDMLREPCGQEVCPHSCF